MVWGMGYSLRSALTVAFGLTQIGEFSFLLAEEAVRSKMLPEDGHSLVVACAILSITCNPLLFRCVGPLERWLHSRPRLWKALARRSESGMANINAAHMATVTQFENSASELTAVVVGFGPVGRSAAGILSQFGVRPIVIDLNVDTVRSITGSGQLAVYGDATQRDILETAGIHSAKYLLVTVPDVFARTMVILAAKDLNPDLRVFARARYLQERAWLEEVGATGVVTEEAETAVGLATLLLEEVGADEERVRAEVRRIEEEFNVRRLND